MADNPRSVGRTAGGEGGDGDGDRSISSRSKSSFMRAMTIANRLFANDDESMKHLRDLLRNTGIFVAAVVLASKYGDKLSI
mmetsp:Transcript_6225/g.17108  ORF Transcript_6225/g.17108 Transcript_6225/m.17108 type:complete len:81 (-) Transcript_6225:23-265(-)